MSNKPLFPHPLETVFLDRDGVINEKPPEGKYVCRWEEFHMLPGAAEAVARLNQAGLRVVVVSNQRGISRGLYTAADVQAMHDSLQTILARHGGHIDAFFFCPHGRQECNCRKPSPGLFDQARATFPQISTATSVVIGDSLSDIEFACRLKMSSIFISGDPERQKPGAKHAIALADAHFNSLSDAVDALLNARMEPVTCEV